ncbi:alpha-ketoglutarate-dependent 2,4-dichlorophenoxyacetate dioxygenase [Xylaria bambusicola]|uniref:alpha-ketoglutarate-dependent 2,4-dichlorophenoxyacetate dioxygenase n=1 Tax=Xylaria bambusicola TaxID=326684 RepID=UPI002008B373|nr:alpha-ketoglutarate-dependent 2,4-dichlorophenoxyacetate dioxygenase [Xylaria bambusicola]KAI0517951.1 alpha-ketoglutarate-dependent 2,4-dichlorophenoxyacetate dioxygenase [Xylaria bambusicola]
MPGLLEEQTFKTIEIKELHPTFGAEVLGVNFEDVSEEQFSEIMAAMTKYGVCVFRNTGLTDESHVAFSRRFGELDTIRRYMPPGRRPRYGFYELFDAGNVSTEPTGSLNHNGDGEETAPRPLDPSSLRAHTSRGNGLFHADSSFNPQRASFSLLRAAELPPKGTGADTLFADSRTAAEELSEELLQILSGGMKADKNNDEEGNEREKMDDGGRDGAGKGLIGVHSIAHSRKLGSPEFFADLDPTPLPMSRHRILQRHEPSGRMNLYVGAHLHHIEHDEDGGSGKEIPDSWALVQKLNAHASQDKYVISVPWNDPGDLVIWDNRAVLHRVGEGSFEGKYIRDLRRTTVHDDSPTAWGFNIVGAAFPSSLTGPNGEPR